MDWRLCAEFCDCPMEESAILQRLPPAVLLAGVATEVANAMEPDPPTAPPPTEWWTDSPLETTNPLDGTPPDGLPPRCCSLKEPEATLRLPPVLFPPPDLLASLLRRETRVERGRRRYESRRNAVISKSSIQAANRSGQGKSRPEGLTLAFSTNENELYQLEVLGLQKSNDVTTFNEKVFILVLFHENTLALLIKRMGVIVFTTKCVINQNLF